HGLRAGTENVPGLVGLGEACRIAEEDMGDYIPEMKRLRDKLIRGIDEKIEKSYLNGHPTKRLVNNVNFSFEAVEGESILLQMDSRGIEASTGSACSSKELEPSQAILALGRDEELAHSSIRLTLGKYTEEEHVDKVLEVLPDIISNLRAMSPLWEGN
ncbi:MAG: cysteine desulfurase family protein, partial [Thermoplasmatota archaeon]